MTTATDIYFTRIGAASCQGILKYIFPVPWNKGASYEKYIPIKPHVTPDMNRLGILKNCTWLNNHIGSTTCKSFPVIPVPEFPARHTFYISEQGLDKK